MRRWPTNVSIGYVILKETDPTQVLQRSEEPIIVSNVFGENPITYGLIRNPHDYPENITEEFDPEFSENIECFIGVYDDDDKQNINLFDVCISWVEYDPTTTNTFYESSTTESTDLNEKFTTSSKEASENNTSQSSKTSIILISISALLIFLAVIAVIIYFYRRNKIRNSLIKIFMEQQEISSKEAKVLAETADQYRLNTKQITIYYDKKIGSGSTAIIYKGFLHGKSAAFARSSKNFVTDDKYSDCKIAVKIPKELSHFETAQIMRELQAMRQIGYHSHIAVLLGWCFQNDLPTLIFELAQQDLHTYACSFRKLEDDSFLPLKETLLIAWQISVGMEYVSNLKIIHRDLAARNILLYDGLHAKISDFGLCCFCDETLTYQAFLEKKLPIRWLSIEALKDKLFSEKSDVWAFGILLYEIYTKGAVPYSYMSNSEILDFLQSGERLEKPENSNDEMYDLMLDCWIETLTERLTFAKITTKLKQFLEDETKTYGYLTIEAGHETAKS